MANQLTQESHHGDTVDYSYDLLGQLTAADYALQADEFYNYDANGNRTSSSVHGSGYVTGANNQLLSDGDFNYDYDAEGNQIRKTEISTGNVSEYEYDHRNRLTRVTEKSSGGIILSESSYVYDVEGRRIAQTVDSDGDGPAAAETTYYTYNGANTWADFDESGNVLARYLYGTEIDEILARWQPGNGTAWYLADRLGTVRDLVDATGALLNQIDYDSFGQVLAQTNASAGDRFLFTGRELDAATQQYFSRARYYNASTGRFTQQDPIGFSAGDTNLYRYVGNRVTSATDPSGRLAVSESASQSSKKDPQIAEGACRTGTGTSKALEVIVLLLGLGIGEQPPQAGNPGALNPGAGINQPIEPKPPKPRPPRPRGGRGGKGMSHPMLKLPAVSLG